MSLAMNQFYEAVAGFAPNPLQERVWEEMAGGDFGLLVKAGTGTGKTESTALPALNAGKQLIMVYPTRSLVDDQIGRFSTYLERISALEQYRDKIVTLTIDTGARSQRICWRNGAPFAGTSERLTRHLYSGNVIITTLDKFIYRYFGFGEPRKGYIYPLRIRHMQPIICFDEAHSYEAAALTNFSRLVRALYEHGRNVVLMTATMPAQYQQELFHYLDEVDFTTGAHGAKIAHFMREVRGCDQPDKQMRYLPLRVEKLEGETVAPAIQQIATLVQQADPSKRTIAVIESVKDAAAVFRQVRSAAFFYHGRLAHPQREAVYREVKRRDENDEGYLLITTAAIEVGCDLNAHHLISQLCDPDKLIQRAGRCNRNQRLPNATVTVVGDAIPEWATALPDDAPYVAALAEMDGETFDVGRLREYIEKPIEEDTRVAVMFDMLQEYVYDARLENKALHENGLIVTRSWEPTITLTVGERDGLEHKVTVPLPYCRIPKDQGASTFNICVYKRQFNAAEYKWESKTVGKWECGYKIDLIAELGSYTYEDGDLYDPELGFVDLPRLFHGPFKSRESMLLKRQEGENSSIIWYVDPEGMTLQPFEDLAAASGVEEDK